MDLDDDPFALEIYSAPVKPPTVQPKPPTPVLKPASITYYDDLDPFSVELPPFTPVIGNKPAETAKPAKVEEIHINAIKDFHVDPSGKVELHVEWKTPTGSVLSWESRDILFSHIPTKQLERFSTPISTKNSPSFSNHNNTTPTTNTPQTQHATSTQSNTSQTKENTSDAELEVLIPAPKSKLDGAQLERPQNGHLILPDRPKTPERQHNSWLGVLEKGGRSQCAISIQWLQCNAPTTTTITKINVTQRCDRSKALKKPVLGVLEMVPNNPSDTANFKKFMEYLRQKERVGMVSWEDLVVFVCLPDEPTIHFLQTLMIDVPQSQKFENYVLYGIVSRKSVHDMHNQT